MYAHCCFTKAKKLLFLGLFASTELISVRQNVCPLSSLKKQVTKVTHEEPTPRNARERHAQAVREKKEKQALEQTKRVRSTPEERLFEAVHRRKKRNVRAALHKGADPNTQDKNGFTPLYYAIKENRIIDSLGIIKFLLEKGASAHLSYDLFERTLLHEIITDTKKTVEDPSITINRDTVIQRKIRILKLLLAKAPTLASVPDKLGQLPIHTAVLSGIGEFVELLLKSNKHINTPEGVTLDTPLHKAAEHGHPAIITLLLLYGADPEAKNSAQKTPLEWTTLLACDANQEAKKILEVVKAQQEEATLALL